MKNIIKVVLLGFLLGAASYSHAGIINFISLTEDPGGYGEGAWDPLVLSVGGATMTVTGHASDDTDGKQYAYLDWGNAGLGTCKDVMDAAKVNTMVSGRTANNCDPSSDDNVTFYEYLRFVFDRDVVITNFWFNNNHDGGFDAGDQVKIGGVDYNVATGYAGGANGIGSFSVAAGDYIDVAFSNEQFYISGIEVISRVDESGTFMMMIFGLMAMFGIRRRK